MTKVPKAPYKKDEFDAFLATLEKGSDVFWYEIATALGVERHTIQKWKKHPKAKALIDKELQEALSMMKVTGNKDWRMWRERAKIMGIAERQELDVTSDGEKLQRTDEQLDALIESKLEKLKQAGKAGTP